MVEVTTKSGFHANVNEECFNDMELLEDIIAVEEEDMRKLPKVVDKILGNKKTGFYDFLRKEDGRVPIDRVSAELIEIIGKAGGKNS